MADGAEKKGFLSKMFNWKTIGKFVLWTAPLFIGMTFGTEIFSFVWGHESVGGQELIASLKQPVLDFVDWTGIDEASSNLANWITETYNTSATDYIAENSGEYMGRTQGLGDFSPSVGF